jgi:calcineurin-like phosphoesterase family protein
MIYFTSDTHFKDERLELFHRDMFDLTTNQIDTIMLQNLTDTLKKDDTLYHLGDVALKDEGLLNMNLPCRKILIKGNYDEEGRINQELLNSIFDEIYDELTINIQGVDFYLNHYPNKCIDKEMSICGHIHGLWKVQKNMINVGTDAWHFKPVSEDKIIFTYNAIKKHYDDNVFPY